MAVTKETAAAWLDAYVQAWQSYDPQAIGALFAENATYAYQPWDEPVRGREAIVASLNRAYTTFCQACAMVGSKPGCGRRRAMAEEPNPIDISNLPELLRIAEEVRATRRSRLLKRGNESVAIVTPVETRGGRAKRVTKPDREATLAAAGSWSGLVDAEALKEQIRAERGSDRAPASL